MKKSIVSVIILLFISLTIVASESRLLSEKYGPSPIAKLDSVDIKLIYWDKYTDEYYGIDRKAFEQTFDYLYGDTIHHKSLVHIKIKDIVSLLMFHCLISWTIEPFPTDGISIYPNEIMRRSNGFDSNFGIMERKATNDDPLEIRGKLVLYTQDGRIDAYISLRSIDILNHRYRLGKALEDFFWNLSVYNAQK